MDINEKVSKKDLELIDVSANKGTTVDLAYMKNRYMGGDNDVFEGFYDSQDEVEFENFKNKGKKGTA